MRKFGLFAAAIVAGCSTAAVEPPVRGGTAGRTCSQNRAAAYVGQPATSEIGSAILSATNAAVLRWAPPGMMMTMEFRADRVTVHIGPDGRITKVSCG